MRNSKIPEISLQIQERIKNNPKIYPVFIKIYEYLPPYIIRPKIYPGIIKSLEHIEKNPEEIDVLECNLEEFFNESTK